MESALKPILISLAWIGKHGSRAVAISIFLGIALPDVSATLKPFIPQAIFALLVVAFLKVDVIAVRSIFSRPKAVILATFWAMIVLPALLGGLILALDIEQYFPGIMIAFALMIAAPPIMAAPAFASFLKLDGALSLSVLVLMLVITPLTAPLLTNWLSGGELSMNVIELSLRLSGYLAGSVCVAFLLRRLIGRSRIEQNSHSIDGINVLLMFLFAISLMDGFQDWLVKDLSLVLTLTAFAFVISLVQILSTHFVFYKLGHVKALTIGLASGNRNMGLMVAAAGAMMPDMSWLWFAVVQFPIYLLPLFLGPIARKIVPA